MSSGVLGVSERLRQFVEEAPYERRTILEFVRNSARGLPAGARVADIGAGDSPYREFFDHCEYLAIDWGQSIHSGALRADVVCSADHIALPDESVDAALVTQVLEHVPDPRAVLRDVHRILRMDGPLYLTVPLIWELHEFPYDYYRYTPPLLRLLLEQAGFGDVKVEPRNDCFTTIAQLMRNAGGAMGRAGDQRDLEREKAQQALERLSDSVAALAPLDLQHIMPRGYSVVGRRGVVAAHEKASRAA
jgi:SAM-dependent methyltransferase